MNPTHPIGGRRPGPPRSRGAILLVLAVALVLLGLILVPLGVLSVQNARRGQLAPSWLQALYLAEAGAKEAVALIRAGSTFKPQPVPVCQTSSPCDPSSPDYVGRYCYSTGSLGGLSCSATSSGGVWTIVAVGETKDGVARKVRVVYDAQNDALQRWEVDP